MIRKVFKYLFYLMAWSGSLFWGIIELGSVLNRRPGDPHSYNMAIAALLMFFIMLCAFISALRDGGILARAAIHTMQTRR